MKPILAMLSLSFGLLAATVNLTGITCTSQTATVSCTGCGIVQYQGFSIQGSSVPAYNVNATAATGAANSFTFTLPAGASCAGSATGGTVQPAKQIINISSAVNSQGNITINYVSWFTTLTPTPTLNGSQWSGASDAENAAILAGTTLEIAGSITIAPSTSSTTLSTNLVAQYNSAQASYNTGFLGFSGYWWNGTAWVNH